MENKCKKILYFKYHGRLSRNTIKRFISTVLSTKNISIVLNIRIETFTFCQLEAPLNCHLSAIVNQGIKHVCAKRDLGMNGWSWEERNHRKYFSSSFDIKSW